MRHTCLIVVALLWTSASTQPLSLSQRWHVQAWPVQLRLRGGGLDPFAEGGKVLGENAQGGGLEEERSVGDDSKMVRVESRPDATMPRKVEVGPHGQALAASEGAGRAAGQEMSEEEQMRQQLLSRILSREAFERMRNVQFSNPKRAAQIEDKLVFMARSGQLLQALTDAQLVRIMEATQAPRTFASKKIKYQRRSSMLDTLGLDPEYAKKLGVEIGGWDMPLEEADRAHSEYSSVEVPGSVPDDGTAPNEDGSDVAADAEEF